MNSIVLRSILAVAVVALVACGSDKEATPNSADALRIVTPFSVAGAPATTLTSEGLRSALNGEAALMKLTVDGLLAPSLRTASLSRLESGIASCVQQKLRLQPVAVTSENLRIEYDLDFTSLCDEAPKTKETVPEIANTASGTIVIGCVGGDFQRFAGKTFGEVRDAGGACAAAPLIHYVAEMRYGARKVVKVTASDGTFTEAVTVDEGHFMWSGADGRLCSIERDPVEKTKVTVGPCRLAITTKTYGGTRANEALPPTDVSGPRVLALEASLGSLSYESNAPSYSNGTTAFAINGWNGTITYTNGWAPPRWEAKDAAGVAATGTLGQQEVTDGASVTAAPRMPRAHKAAGAEIP